MISSRQHYKGSGGTNQFKQRFSIFLLSVVLVIIGLLSAVSICTAQDTWTRKADIPTPRWYLSSCAANGKIYAIGGVGSYQKVEEYDIATDTWATKAFMPTGRAFLATGAVNGKIYAIGGSVIFEAGRAAIEEYDPATDTWTTKANMPTPRHGVCAGVVDGKIYVIGGQDGNIAFKKVEMYDPTTDSWTPKQDMPTARWAPTYVVVSGKIYVFGGLVNANAGGGLSVVEMYDPATDTWTRKADMPERRYAHAIAVVNGLVYIFGGTTDGGALPPYSNLWVYDPQTDTWDTSLPNMPFNWFAMGYSVVNERVYLMAGSEIAYPCGDNLKKVYEFDPLATGVEVISAFPGEFALHQNYPNPFNLETTIEYQLPRSIHIKLVVYNLMGQEVKTLIDKSHQAGHHNLIWNGRDNLGRAVPSGVYFYQIQAEGFVKTEKMLLMK